MTNPYRLIRLAVFLGAFGLLASFPLARDDGRHARDQAYQSGYSRGYSAGYDHGRRDLDRHARYDYQCDAYRRADLGFSGTFRSHKDAYGDGFRAAFRLGYADGYSGRRHQSGAYGEFGFRYGDRGADARGSYRYGYSDRGRYGDRYEHGYSGTTYSMGRRNGYEKGLEKGRKDFRKERRFDPNRHDAYHDADDGYRSKYGSKAVYRDGFRQGFLEGYREGYGGGHYRH